MRVETKSAGLRKVSWPSSSATLSTDLWAVSFLCENKQQLIVFLSDTHAAAIWFLLAWTNSLFNGPASSCGWLVNGGAAY